MSNSLRGRVKGPTSPVVLDLMEAALASSGEIGYLGTSVQSILDRSQRSRASFYRYFNNKADCFQRAYDEKASWLLAELLGSVEGEGCDVQSRLLKLADFMIREPLQARAVLVEARFAGGAPAVEYRRKLEALATALDRSLRPAANPVLPACSGRFVVGAVETTACMALTRGEPESFLQVIPELVLFVSSIYGRALP